MKYKCSKCGKYHDELPAIGFDAPHYYYILSEEKKEKVKMKTDDFCVIEHEGQTDRFIRTVIKFRITDSCETLDYGIWVSLSEKSFSDYYNNYEDDHHKATYFGYISSDIQGYPDILKVKSKVVVTDNKERPEVFPHEDQKENNFVKDYYNGISLAEAERRIKLASE